MSAGLTLFLLKLLLLLLWLLLLLLLATLEFLLPGLTDPEGAAAAPLQPSLLPFIFSASNLLLLESAPIWEHV